MSQKTIAEKLMLKPGRSLLILNAPSAYLENIGPLPDFSRIVEINEPAEVVQLFVRSLAELDVELLKVAKLVKPTTLFWICYPKKTSSIKTDLNRDILHAVADLKGWLGVSLIAIDGDWSAMRFKAK
ncbi:MAG: hypothetical protein AB9897_06185 [Anaerolineaceae bacterium]